MNKTTSALLIVFIAANLGLAEETSFRSVKVPDLKGNQNKAVLTFSDERKAVEVHPVKKGDPVTIAYNQIDKCSYEFTKKHRITQGVLIGAVSPGVGLIVFLTHSKSHWLEIDYHDQDTAKVFVVRMDKHDYVQVLESLKSHTGQDAEVLGNADKRQK